MTLPFAAPAYLSEAMATPFRSSHDRHVSKHAAQHTIWCGCATMRPRKRHRYAPCTMRHASLRICCAMAAASDHTGQGLASHPRLTEIASDDTSLPLNSHSDAYARPTRVNTHSRAGFQTSKICNAEADCVQNCTWKHWRKTTETNKCYVSSCRHFYPTLALPAPSCLQISVPGGKTHS